MYLRPVKCAFALVRCKNCHIGTIHIIRTLSLGCIPDLMGELNTLAITLNHCETHFVQMTVKDTEVSLNYDP